MTHPDFLAFETLKEDWGEYELEGERIIVLGKSMLAVVRAKEEGQRKGLAVRVHNVFISIDLARPLDSEPLTTNPPPPGAEQVKIDVKRTFRLGEGLSARREHESLYRLADGTIFAIRARIQEIRLLAGRAPNGDPLIQVDHMTDMLAAPNFLMETIEISEGKNTFASTAKP